MAVTLASPPAADDETIEQHFVIGGIDWDAYVAMNDALDEHVGVRMIYCDGRLTFVGKSRKHDWYGERLGELIKAVARGLGLPWEDAGQATYRRENMNAGLEGDKTFYLGSNAELMRGPQDIDLDVQPAPDLAIEVEVSHVADAALLAWEQLGVSEVWLFRPKQWEIRFLVRAEGGFRVCDQSLGFPVLKPADVLSQMARAKDLGADRWNEQLEAWVRDVILPRLVEGAS
jgi:Uma2 family endonuclease